MNRKLLPILFAAILVFAGLGLATPTDASNNATIYTVVSSTLEVKETANVQSKKIATIKKNDFVVVIGVSNGWATVQYQDKRGFVKAGSIKKKTGTSKQVSAKAGLKIYEKPSTKAFVKTTVKTGVKVTDYGKLDKTWSFVQYNGTVGYALTASLKTATATTSTGFGFYQGLVPSGFTSKKPLDFMLYADGIGAMYFDKFKYTGSKSKGTYTLVATGNKYGTAYHKYSETKKGFTFLPGQDDMEVRVDYPLKVNAKKTYTVKQNVYNFETDKSTTISNKLTTTVKAVNGKYTSEHGSEFANAIVVEVTGKNFEAFYVFRKNVGLIYSREDFGNYGMAVERTGVKF